MKVRFTNPALTREDKSKKRLKFFYLALCFGFLVIIGRAVDLMLQDNEKLEEIALRQYRAAIQQASDRSRILDRKGQELAISVPTWSLYVDPKHLKNGAQMAEALAPVLGVSKESLLEKFKEKKRFVWIKRRVTAATMEKVRQLNLDRLHNIKENMRFYPHGELAASILGAVGIDAQALAGIEMAYDSYLMIKQTSGVSLRDARGQLYRTPSPNEGPSNKGDVYLTIDKNLQFFAEKVVTEASQKSNAKAGLAMLLNPKTGAILGIANYPSYNPNRFDHVDFAAWRNRAVTDVYEPGSTFKVITAAAAIESGVVSKQDKFFCENGSLQFEDGRVVHDHEPYGWLTLADIIKVSSNIGIYKVSQKLGREKFYEVMTGFGFGRKTGIDFPGEVGGILRHYKKWRPIEQANISFGQGIGITPLQILSAFGAIANGGTRMKPYLVEKIIGKNGEILFEEQPQSVAQPISPKTASLLTEMLKRVVEKGGTAPLAAIEEYPVAGKTGTAQKVEGHGGYSKGKYMASFIGFAPANDPQLVGLVLLDEPQGSYYGGVVAGPAFKELMLHALPYIGVPPQGEKGVWVAKKETLPEPAKMVADTAMTQEGNLFKVPDFQGSSLRHVLKSAGSFPIEVEFKGRGKAITQRPEAGALVSAGSKIFVEFEPMY
ncbi:MAG: hypothetical protein A3H42_03600 [Deltaproteobacteria bacterium RIFCSPLOWO2_02_FULL_46_8]|nr:MAG: hypothetical protein A3H42_03600 [Deltaproteobacteria bacterium RIFCSPLOWO2_02_FULL_46_8]